MNLLINKRQQKSPINKEYHPIQKWHELFSGKTQKPLRGLYHLMHSRVVLIERERKRKTLREGERRLNTWNRKTDAFMGI